MTTFPVAHVEELADERTGHVTLIRCECPIGHDHTYAEWVASFGRDSPQT